MSKRIRPFSNGSQYTDWEERNCSRCKLDMPETGKRFRCPLQKALTLAYWGDGTISETEAKGIGLDESDPPHYTWACASFVPEDNAKRERKPSKTREHQGQQKLRIEGAK